MSRGKGYQPIAVTSKDGPSLVESVENWDKKIVISQILLLGWAVSMTVFWFNATYGSSHATYDINPTVFECNPNIGQCFTTQRDIGGASIKRMQHIKFNSSQQCTEACVKSSINADISEIPTDQLTCDTDLSYITWSVNGNTIGICGRCPTVAQVRAVPSPWAEWGQSGPCHPGGDSSTGPTTTQTCTDQQLADGKCGTAITFQHYWQKCPYIIANSQRFYPVKGNTLLSMNDDAGQVPSDVQWCARPDWVKTWVKTSISNGYWMYDRWVVGTGNSRTCPAVESYNSTQYINAPLTASADNGCEYADNTFAEVGECGTYYDEWSADTVYTCALRIFFHG